MISDEPLSKETNYRTEFVAVLANQPQGGFITRKPTPVVVADRDAPYDDGFGSFFRNFGGPPQPLDPRRVGQPRPVQRGFWE